MALRILTDRILNHVGQDLCRAEFLHKIAQLLLEFIGCDAVEIRLKDSPEHDYRCERAAFLNNALTLEFIPCATGKKCQCAGEAAAANNFQQNCPYQCQTPAVDANIPSIVLRGTSKTKKIASASQFPTASIAILPLILADEIKGLLQLSFAPDRFITGKDMEKYQHLTPTLALALVTQRAQAALSKRVRELTCLCEISRIMAQAQVSEASIMQQIVTILPSAWQYPEKAAGRIVIGECSYVTDNYETGFDRQIAKIIISGLEVGWIEIIYLEKKPDLEEGPFLHQERNLLNTVARQIALFIEHKKMDLERQKLEEQLRHADRLATIGQLAAGVAHEINEPLGSILGFAQLAVKCKGLPVQAEKDLNKIIAASLHAREVIKKLMLFARQMPPKKLKVNLNYVINEGLYFFESRCEKEGIQLTRILSAKLPEIYADPFQIHQALVNLVVNSLQAMPAGGRLTIRTRAEKDYISLTVEDTGTGISDAVKKQMFMPFYTTKDVGKGTGIGLSVVHGIVSAHGGTIHVDSKVGCGTRFEIRLPIISKASPESWEPYENIK